MDLGKRVQNVNYPKIQCSKLKHQYECQRYCDITLTTSDVCAGDVTTPETSPVANHVLDCHKIVLATASSYFKQIIDDNNQSIMIDVSPVDINVVKEAVSFMYNGECLIEAGNVIDLLEVSVLWDIPLLTEECLEFVKESINPGNADLYYELAIKYQEAELIDTFSHFIRKHFGEIYEATQFKNIYLENLYRIIGHDQINIRNEDVIFKALITERNNEKSPRKIDFRYVRFEYLSDDFLFDVVLDHFVMRIQPQNDFLKFACRYKSQQWWGKKAGNSPRYWGDKHRQIVTIDKDRCIIIYDEINDKWNKMMVIPDWVQKNTVCCMQGSNLIMIGGTESEENYNHKAISIDVKQTPQYTYLRSLKVPKAWPGIAGSDEYVYLCGGQSRVKDKIIQTGRVERLCVRDNEWVSLRNMKMELNNSLVIEHFGKLYVIGGLDREETDTALMYDIETSTWKKLRNLPETVDNYSGGILVYQEKITVIKSTVCMVYDNLKDRWMTYRYDDIGDVSNAFIYKGYICSCVESDDTVFKRYDIENNQWDTINMAVSVIYSPRFVFTF